MISAMANPKDDSYPTRPSLLKRLKDTQDQRSWQEFHDLYRKLILGFALKAGLTETEAEEVVQETMIAAVKNLPEFRYDPEVCSFKTWLLNLSRWRVQDQLRKRVLLAPAHPSNLTDPHRTTTIERVPDPAGVQLEAIWEKEWQTSLLGCGCITNAERSTPTSSLTSDGTGDTLSARFPAVLKNSGHLEASCSFGPASTTEGRLMRQ